MAGYIEKVLSFIDVGSIRPFKVVLDGGSGMAGRVAPLLFERLPCQVTSLCMDVDGTFPNHEANPLLEENRADITAAVVREKADIGIAWDGDADRCFFIDGSGEFISGDFMTALLAEAFLLKTPGATIIYDLRASHAVKDVVARYGGRALMNRVGHAFIKQRMRQEDGVFAGEVTGHYYFKDYYYADNGFIPALLVLELMSKKGLSLRDLLAPLRERYFISGEINTKLASMDEVPRVLSAVEKRYSDATIGRIDGISVDYPDLALQRAGIEHRAAGAVEPRGGDAGADGRQARRGLAGHPRLTSGRIACVAGRPFPGSQSPSLLCWRHQPRTAITASRRTSTPRSRPTSPARSPSTRRETRTAICTSPPWTRTAAPASTCASRTA